MKFLLPAVLSLLLAACETIVPEPAPGTVEHQRWLHEQARENFLALKAAERARRGQVEPARTAARTLNKPLQSKPLARTQAARPERSRPAPARRRVATSDTIYEPTPQGLAELREWEERKARQYQVYEAIEAKRLGKTPQTLTRAERAWIRSRAN